MTHNRRQFLGSGVGVSWDLVERIEHHSRDARVFNVAEMVEESCIHGGSSLSRPRESHFVNSALNTCSESRCAYPS